MGEWGRGTTHWSSPPRRSVANAHGFEHGLPGAEHCQSAAVLASLRRGSRAHRHALAGLH